jgi:hypothetical protein
VRGLNADKAEARIQIAAAEFAVADHTLNFLA